MEMAVRRNWSEQKHALIHELVTQQSSRDKITGSQTSAGVQLRDTFLRRQTHTAPFQSLCQSQRSDRPTSLLSLNRRPLAPCRGVGACDWMSQNIVSPSYTRIYAYVRITNTAVRCAGSVASRVRPHTASQPAMTMQQCEQRRVSECAAVFIVQTHTEAEHHKPALSCAVPSHVNSESHAARRFSATRPGTRSLSNGV